VEFRVRGTTHPTQKPHSGVGLLLAIAIRQLVTNLAVCALFFRGPAARPHLCKLASTLVSPHPRTESYLPVPLACCYTVSLATPHGDAAIGSPKPAQSRPFVTRDAWAGMGWTASERNGLRPMNRGTAGEAMGQQSMPIQITSYIFLRLFIFGTGLLTMG
jgi:hypothetical protein